MREVFNESEKGVKLGAHHLQIRVALAQNTTAGLQNVRTHKRTHEHREVPSTEAHQSVKLLKVHQGVGLTL